MTYVDRKQTRDRYNLIISARQATSARRQQRSRCLRHAESYVIYMMNFLWQCISGLLHYSVICGSINLALSMRYSIVVERTVRVPCTSVAHWATIGKSLTPIVKSFLHGGEHVLTDWHQSRFSPFNSHCTLSAII